MPGKKAWIYEDGVNFATDNSKGSGSLLINLDDVSENMQKAVFAVYDAFFPKKEKHK